MNVDESHYANDGKYKSYISQVERVLKGFEYSTEWADLITNVTKLIRVLQANAKYPAIPKKQIIGKRLSQCLHPSLPSGVHIKVLECYDVIFKNIGPKILSDDLFIYCTGLFPLMSPSATNVKKPLFDLYENHFLPLNKAVRPAFDGLLQGLLPGLEEGTEFFERANNILEKFCVSVEPTFFYTSLWHVMYQAPSIRLYGTTFLITHFNKKKSVEDQLYLFGNNINMMLNSISQLLSDSQALVQRQSLDFVLMALQIHKCQLTKSDTQKLCAACLNVLLRRDMSLNRRFYSWLMGGHLDKTGLVENIIDKSNEPLSLIENELQMKYFKRYSKTILVVAIRLIVSDQFNIPNEKQLSIKPFRIMMTLMDRPEIGSEIIEDVLLDLIIYMEKEYQKIGQQIKLQTLKFPIYNSQQEQQQQQQQLQQQNKKLPTQEEFLKTCNLFFSNLDGGFFWGFLTTLFNDTFNGINIITQSLKNVNNNHNNYDNIDHICHLVEFLLNNLPIETYSDVHSCHLPKLLWTLTELMEKNVSQLGIMSLEMVLRIYRCVFTQIIQHDTKILFEKNAANTMETEMKQHQTQKSSSLSSDSSNKSEDMKNKISKIIQMSIYKFREFFKSFCISKLGITHDQIKTCANNIFGKSSKSNKYSLFQTKDSSQYIEPNSIKLDISVDRDTINVYGVICQIIGEMNSYPVCASAQIGGYFSIFQEEEEKLDKCETSDYKIPQWFICLIISGCLVDNFRIKTESMTTILTMIHTSRSFLGAHCSDNNKSGNKKLPGIPLPGTINNSRDDTNTTGNFDSNSDIDNNVFVNFPVLSPEIINQLDKQSCFYLNAGLSLWHYLSEFYPECHQTTVQLLYNLHKTCPTPNTCEDMILQKLLSESQEVSLDAHRRFILLWQLLAKIRTSESNGISSRNFDKCMLVLLDGLDTSNEVLRTMCHSWLEGAFQQGNSNEILAPLILGTLKPDTARISLDCLLKLSSSSKKSRNLTQADSNDYGNNQEMDNKANAEEKRIYAISNENGNVRYHLKSKPVDEVFRSSELSKPDSASIKYKQSTNYSNSPSKSLNKAAENEVIDKMDEVLTSLVSDKGVDELSELESNCEDDLDNGDCVVSDKETDQTNPMSSSMYMNTTSNNFILPLHQHFLMYCSVYDSNCVLYSLSRIKAIIKSIPIGLFVAVLHNLIGRHNSLSDDDLRRHKCAAELKIYELLARHHNALRGHNFYQNPTIDEIEQFKSYNFLEIILLISTWYIRSYFVVTSSSSKSRVQPDESDRLENKKVQMMSGEIIDLVVQEMLHILQVGYVNYRGDFVTESCGVKEIKHKFQSTFNTKCDIASVSLHTMATSITRLEGISEYLSDTIFMFNENVLDEKIRDSFQIGLMKLVLNVLKLDYGLNPQYVLWNNKANKDKNSKDLQLPSLKKDLFYVPYTSSNTMYIAVSRQSILLTSIVACLGANQLRHLHTYCYNFLISSLGVWGYSTSTVLVHIVKRLCKNLRLTAETYERYSEINWGSNNSSGSLNNSNSAVIRNEQKHEIIPDYGVTTLQCLRAICHFLLLDKALKSYQIQEEKSSSSEHSILSSLFNRAKEAVQKDDSTSPSTHILEARQNMLHLLPQVMRSITNLWEAVALSKRKNTSQASHPCWIMGNPMTITNLILSIINPLMKQHSAAVLISVARVWPHLNQFKLLNDQFVDSHIIYNMCNNNNNDYCDIDGDDQIFVREKHRTKCILEFARGWDNYFPLDKIILISKDILKKPLFIQHTSANVINDAARKKMEEEHEAQIKENLLEFIQCLLVSLNQEAMKNISVHLFNLFKEILMNLSPNGSFILFKILSDYLSKVPISDDRKEQRELQEMCHKIIEQVSILGGSSLEQPTWFRRTAQVRIDEPSIMNNLSNSDNLNKIIEHQNGTLEDSNNLSKDQYGARDNSEQTKDLHPEESITSSTNTIRTSNAAMSGSTQAMQDLNFKSLNISTTATSKIITIQALQLLATHLASILDVIYKSEEKERVHPFLSSVILPNLIPYLRFRSFSNILNLRVASQLMASLSAYQHTRKSWKKEIFDMFFETYFFQFDLESLQSWKIIMDNLMAQDKTIFKEAFTKLTVTQGGGLNLFSTKEAEYEQTAICLRKLAFIIYSSEPDQYVKSMPEIQERLSDSLRNGMVPQIYTQLFLCFRVLLLRMSPQSMVSIWHILIPIITSSIQSLIDYLKTGTNAIKPQELPKYLPMFLSMAKVLDLILILPEEKVPQFLFYKWSLLGYVEDIETALSATKYDGLSDYEIPNIYDFTPTFQPLINVITDEFSHYMVLNKINSKTVLIKLSDITTKSDQLLIYRETITSIMDLAQFFFTTILRNETNADNKASCYGLKINNHDEFGLSELDYDEKSIEYNFKNLSIEQMAEKIIDKEFIDIF